MSTNYPKLVLAEWFDDRVGIEMPYKGFFLAEVESEDGTRYEINFYDPVRLSQELNDYVSLGKPCFAEQNLIIVPKVTIEAINNSIQYLWEIGFFNFMKAK
jgi:hypothetical protein